MIAKDVWLLLRDRGGLISLFVLPLVFIVAFGSMFRFGPDRGEPRPIAVWHAPGDARGEAITKLLAETPGFVVERAASADEVRSAVAKERVDAGLVILRGTEPIEISIDLAAPIQIRGPIEGALRGVVTRALSPGVATLVEARTPPGSAKPVANASSFQIAVPGNAVLFGFFIALTVAMAFVTDRRTGTWRRLLAAPVSRASALLATLVPYYLIALTQLAFLFGIGVLVFGMQIAGSVAALCALSLAMAYCAVALGLLFAAIGGSERQLGGIGSVVLLVMGMIGGCMMPRLAMPPFMKSLGLGVPHGWALDGYYDVLVREGTGLAEVAPSIGALLGFGTMFALIGVALFRFER